MRRRLPLLDWWWWQASWHLAVSCWQLVGWVVVVIIVARCWWWLWCLSMVRMVVLAVQGLLAPCPDRSFLACEGRRLFGRGVQLVDWQRTREWKVGGGSRVSMRAGVAKLPNASIDALNLVTTTT